MSAVRVQYLKYPDIKHWRHEMVRLGRDEHGIWLGGPAGTIVQRADEPQVAWPTPFVQLVPEGEWWTAVYNGVHGRHFSLYVDVVTPPCWVGDSHVEMIDLDLDVVVFQKTGKVEVLDEDEFEQHAVDLAYPTEMVAGALESTRKLVEAISSRQEPFGNAGERWLEMIT